MSNIVQRYQFADFLNCGTKDAPDYKLMGVGFNTLDENAGAQVDLKQYINGKAFSAMIKSYQTIFAFDSDLISDEDAIMELYNIGRNHKIGSEAEREYVRVELFSPVDGVENTYKARKFNVAVEVASVAGAGGEAIKVTGNLNAIGDFIDGTFDTSKKTFN